MLLKPSLAFSIISLLTPLAHAAYNGGQINNQDGVVNSSGDVNVSWYDPSLTSTATNLMQGAIQIRSSTPMATILNGNNFRITAGSSYDRNGNYANHGIWIPPSTADGSSISLTTLTASDTIVFDIYGQHGYGVYCDSGLSSITLDASQNTARDAIKITTHTTVPGSGGGIGSSGKVTVNGNLTINTGNYALYTEATNNPTGVPGGTIIVNGSVDLTSSIGGLAILAANGTIEINKADAIHNIMGSIESGSISSRVTITGKETYITATNPSLVGINAEYGSFTSNGYIRVQSQNDGVHSFYWGSARFNNGVDIITQSRGIQAYYYSNVYVSGGALNITSSANAGDDVAGIVAQEGSSIYIQDGGTINMTSNAVGVKAQKGNVYFYNPIKISSQGGAAAESTAGGRISFAGGEFSNGSQSNTILRSSGTNSNIIGNAAEYKITGIMQADTSGIINLNMNQNSVFNGSTTTSSAGQINLSLSDNSVWNVSQQSTLTSMNLNAGSRINFSMTGDEFSTTTTNTSTYLTMDTFSLEDDAIIALDMSAYHGEELVAGSAIRLVFSNNYATPGARITFHVSGYQLADGLEWDTRFFASDGIIRVKSKSMPEPTTTALSLLGLSSLLMHRRRVQTKRHGNFPMP